MSATGLSADPGEYRARLDDEPDERIDAWAAELMRDVSIRQGVIRVLADFRAATGVSDAELERIFAVGGGPPAVVGRARGGELMVPAISLHHFVAGLRRESPDARRRLIDFLVRDFHTIVYI